MELTWNGQRVDGVDIVRLPANVSLQQAADYLSQHQDGRDTLGVQGDNGDYLVLGHGLRAPSNNETLSIDGQAVLPAFLENENDTQPEGFVDPRDANVARSQMYTGVTAIAGAVAGGILGARFGGKIGGAIGSAVGLPVAGIIHTFVFKPLARKISGKPTRTMADIDPSVVQSLVGSAATAVSGTLRPIRSQNGNAPATPTLQPIDRSAIRRPVPPQPVTPPPQPDADDGSQGNGAQAPRAGGYPDGNW